MNKEETVELIEELIQTPQHCIFCGGLMVEKGRTDTGYLITECIKCGRIFSEE